MPKFKLINKKAFIGILLTTVLMALTIQVDLDLPFSFDDVRISINEVQAHPVYDDMELADDYCSYTGETYLKCIHGSYVCDARDQGTCSPINPEEG